MLVSLLMRDGPSQARTPRDVANSGIDRLIGLVCKKQNLDHGISRQMTHISAHFGVTGQHSY
jgi:hypothetical protein